jgi:hypothetical protein
VRPEVTRIKVTVNHMSTRFTVTLFEAGLKRLWLRTAVLSMLTESKP